METERAPNLDFSFTGKTRGTIIATRRTLAATARLGALSLPVATIFTPPTSTKEVMELTTLRRTSRFIISKQGRINILLLMAYI